jgi:putative SOS response-associated peptidase YedK
MESGAGQPPADVHDADDGGRTGPYVAPYHNRQVVVVRPEDWSAWLHLTKPEAELLRPLPGGSLDVATVREGSG